MILLFFSEKRNFKCFKFALIRYEYIITKILYLLLFLTILSLFLNSSYIINWSDSYYVGFVGMPHTAASSLCLLMAFFLLIFNDKSFKFYRLCILVCLIGIIFKTGARTFIVPALLICFLYIKDVLKNKWIKMFVYVFVASLITYIFINSNMMDKFLWSADSANQYTSNALSSMTGGRSSFWKIDLHVFFNQNPIFQIIGRGFDFPYLTNLKYYNMHIWAHNDIIDILLSLGYLGCFAYIFIWNIFLKNIFKQKKNKVLYFILLIYIFFPMLINGVFIAQHYLFSIIIFSICITSKKEKALL